MAKTESKTKDAKGVTEPTISDMVALQREAIDAIGDMNNRINALEQTKVRNPVKSGILFDDGEAKGEMMDGGIQGAPVASGLDPGQPEEYPVPKNYTILKNQILGEDFGLRMMNQADKPSFELQVIVPNSKSNMTDLSKELKEKDDSGVAMDIRTMAFNHNTGASSIQGWLMLIRKNLKLDD